MPYFTRTELEDAARLVQASMPATPLHLWPQLSSLAGTPVWIKHENHSPIGAFKIRGGLTFVDWLRQTHPARRGVVTATRGNHGQSLARAATAAGLRAVIYVPHGNSPEKNAAMRAFGAELREFGADFDEARTEAMRAAPGEDLFPVPSFHRELVRGVATSAFEMLLAKPDIHTMYVPIGCGSGICGAIAARDALGLRTRIVGVVSSRAQGALLSVAAGRPVETDSARTFADGMAVRVPVAEALAIYAAGAERIVAVDEDEIAEAIRLIFRATHNVAEGAGAAGLAALLKDGDVPAGRDIATVLSGGNIDSATLRVVLDGGTPSPGPSGERPPAAVPTGSRGGGIKPSHGSGPG